MERGDEGAMAATLDDPGLKEAVQRLVQVFAPERIYLLGSTRARRGGAGQRP